MSLVQRILVGASLLFLLTAAQNETADLSETPPLYRLVVEARETGDSTIPFFLVGKRAVTGFPEISKLRGDFKAARVMIDGGTDVEVALTAYRGLVIQGAALPAFLIWDFCERKSDEFKALEYCDNPVRWLKAASELGDSKAMAKLGWYYARLAEPDMESAYKWFRIASAYGDSEGAAAIKYWDTKSPDLDTYRYQQLTEEWLNADEHSLQAKVLQLIKSR